MNCRLTGLALITLALVYAACAPRRLARRLGDGLDDVFALRRAGL